jgi:hypothetical protein
MELERPYQSRNGKVRQIPYEICRCGSYRSGPAGGVCGICGDAIPTRAEQYQINRMKEITMVDPKYDPNQKPGQEPKKDDESKKKKQGEEDEEEETDKRQEQKPR